MVIVTYIHLKYLLSKIYLHLSMDSESDSIASDDGGGKKEEMKKSIFIKRKSNEGTEDNLKPTVNKSTTSIQPTKPVEKKPPTKTENANLNTVKNSVVSKILSRYELS